MIRQKKAADKPQRPPAAEESMKLNSSAMQTHMPKYCVGACSQSSIWAYVDIGRTPDMNNLTANIIICWPINGTRQIMNDMAELLFLNLCPEIILQCKLNNCEDHNHQHHRLDDLIPFLNRQVHAHKVSKNR